MKDSVFRSSNLAALRLVGCSNTPPSMVNTDPIRANSYSFITGSVHRDVPDFADRRQQVHTLIQDSITQNLGDGLI